MIKGNVIFVIVLCIANVSYSSVSLAMNEQQGSSSSSSSSSSPKRLDAASSAPTLNAESPQNPHAILTCFDVLNGKTEEIKKILNLLIIHHKLVECYLANNLATEYGCDDTIFDKGITTLLHKEDVAIASLDTETRNIWDAFQQCLFDNKETFDVKSLRHLLSISLKLGAKLKGFMQSAQNHFDTITNLAKTGSSRFNALFQKSNQVHLLTKAHTVLSLFNRNDTTDLYFTCKTLSPQKIEYFLDQYKKHKKSFQEFRGMHCDIDQTYADLRTNADQFFTWYDTTAEAFSNLQTDFPAVYTEASFFKDIYSQLYQKLRGFLGNAKKKFPPSLFVIHNLISNGSIALAEKTLTLFEGMLPEELYYNDIHGNHHQVTYQNFLAMFATVTVLPSAIYKPTKRNSAQAQLQSEGAILYWLDEFNLWEDFGIISANHQPIKWPPLTLFPVIEFFKKQLNQAIQVLKAKQSAHKKEHLKQKTAQKHVISPNNHVAPIIPGTPTVTEESPLPEEPTVLQSPRKRIKKFKCITNELLNTLFNFDPVYTIVDSQYDAIKHSWGVHPEEGILAVIKRSDTYHATTTSMPTLNIENLSPCYTPKQDKFHRIPPGLQQYLSYSDMLTQESITINEGHNKLATEYHVTLNNPSDSAIVLKATLFPKYADIKTHADLEHAYRSTAPHFKQGIHEGAYVFIFNGEHKCYHRFFHETKQ